MDDEQRKDIHGREIAHDAGGQPGLAEQAPAGGAGKDPQKGARPEPPADVIDGHEDGLANDALDQGGNKEGVRDA
jgi:hypothetical protein